MRKINFDLCKEEWILYKHLDILFPEVIENVILQNEYVLNVVVTGIEYNLLYNDSNQPNIEKPFAFIELNEKYHNDNKNGIINQDSLKKQLFDLCSRELNAEINEVPEDIYFIDTIPMVSGVKKDRKYLKAYLKDKRDTEPYNT